MESEIKIREDIAEIKGELKSVKEQQDSDHAARNNTTALIRDANIQIKNELQRDIDQKIENTLLKIENSMKDHAKSVKDTCTEEIRHFARGITARVDKTEEKQEKLKMSVFKINTIGAVILAGIMFFKPYILKMFGGQ